MKNKLQVFLEENEVLNIKKKKVSEEKGHTSLISKFDLSERVLNIFNVLILRVFPNKNFTFELNGKVENNHENISVIIDKLFTLYGEDSSGFSSRQNPFIDTDGSRYEYYCWYFDKYDNIIPDEEKKSEIHYGINFIINEKYCDFCILGAQNIMPLSHFISEEKKRSPRITGLQWGKIKFGSKLYKDAKSFPGGSREWDWKETGTRHMPGIQITDIQELIDNGAEVVVLSTGFHERLKVNESTVEHLKKLNIPFFVLRTGEAAKRYNELIEDNLVGGLFHSTC